MNEWWIILSITLVQSLLKELWRWRVQTEIICLVNTKSKDKMSSQMSLKYPWKQNSGPLSTCFLSVFCNQFFYFLQARQHCNNKWSLTHQICSFPQSLTVCFLSASSTVRVQQQPRDCGLPDPCLEDRWRWGGQNWGHKGWSWNHWRHNRGAKSLDPLPGSDPGLELHRTRTMEPNSRSTHRRGWYKYRTHSLRFSVFKLPTEMSLTYCLLGIRRQMDEK